MDVSGVSDSSRSLRTKPSALQSSNDCPSTAVCPPPPAGDVAVAAPGDSVGRVSSMAAGAAVVVAGGVVRNPPTTS